MMPLELVLAILGWRLGDVFLGKRGRASVVFTIPMSAGLGSAELMAGLNDPKDLSQPKQFCDSVRFISLRNPGWQRLKCCLTLPLVVADCGCPEQEQSSLTALLIHLL